MGPKQQDPLYKDPKVEPLVIRAQACCAGEAFGFSTLTKSGLLFRSWQLITMVRKPYRLACILVMATGINFLSSNPYDEHVSYQVQSWPHFSPGLP